jgi:hypothetical protein
VDGGYMRNVSWLQNLLLHFFHEGLRCWLWLFFSLIFFLPMQSVLLSVSSYCILLHPLISHRKRETAVQKTERDTRWLQKRDFVCPCSCVPGMMMAARGHSAGTKANSKWQKSEWSARSASENNEHRVKKKKENEILHSFLSCDGKRTTHIRILYL